jgi:hypothetical protein
VNQLDFHRLSAWLSTYLRNSKRRVVIEANRGFQSNIRGQVRINKIPILQMLSAPEEFFQGRPIHVCWKKRMHILSNAQLLQRTIIDINVKCLAENVELNERWHVNHDCAHIN